METNQTASNLVKAYLKSYDSASKIEFMFNPSEVLFDGGVKLGEPEGTQTQDKGQPKVSFAYVKPYQVTIKKIIFDTYEKGSSVNTYIDKFREAIKFVDGKKRPPIYAFHWGAQVHLRCCFIETLTYKFTMFLPDGTPVRAVIDSLTLKEVDPPQLTESMSPKSELTVMSEKRKEDDLELRKKFTRTDKLANH